MLDVLDEWLELNKLEESESLMEMANVAGDDFTLEPIKFSFYFSDCQKCKHEIRVKVKWDPEGTSGRPDGFFKLFGNFDYVHESNKKENTDLIKHARAIFKKYHPLFVLVWNRIIDESQLQKYFIGNITWDQLISKAKRITEEEYFNLNHAKNLVDLETVMNKIAYYTDENKKYPFKHYNGIPSIQIKNKN